MTLNINALGVIPPREYYTKGDWLKGNTMKTVRINASTPYDILIGNGLLDRCGELCREAVAPCKACIITDDTVSELYLGKVKSSLDAADFETVSFVFPHGERSKTTGVLVNILEFLAQNRITRSDCLVALGGGVVGDICGFAAAVYMRGIKFIQIPTTLLACVDSSVGGKTAVDLEAGKNLMGAFHQPARVICDYSTLSTLPPEIFADGCAEVIKYGVINDREFFFELKGGIAENIESVIARCVENKARIVEADEFEHGCRQLLNLGHTVGHAIEACSEFSISHGSAVAIGTAIVTRASVKRGSCEKSELDELISLLSANGLPTECTFSAEQLTAVATADKKRTGDTITLVVPRAIGNTELISIPIDELCEFISLGL